MSRRMLAIGVHSADFVSRARGNHAEAVQRVTSQVVTAL